MKRVFIIGVILAALAFGLSKCIESQRDRKEAIISTELKEGEHAKVIINSNTKTITTVSKRNGSSNSKETKVIKKEGLRYASITVDDTGNVTVTAPTHGFVAEPGFTLFVSDKPRMGIDCQLYYWKRWGVGFGTGINIGDEPRTIDAFGAVYYNFPFEIISNTSIFVGYSIRKQPVVGLRIKF